jgi:hypothetical protein
VTTRRPSIAALRREIRVLERERDSHPRGSDERMRLKFQASERRRTLALLTAEPTTETRVLELAAALVTEAVAIRDGLLRSSPLPSRVAGLAVGLSAPTVNKIRSRR